MCTLAWSRADSGLWVCFNRDEQRTRSLAFAPEIHHGGRYPLLYARDPDGGGTWFAISGAGYLAAVLNHYPGGGEKVPGLRSRGQLLLELACHSSPGEAAVDLESADLSSYAPFSLFIISPGMDRRYTWTGTGLQRRDNCEEFWTTSSRDPESVIPWRISEWGRLGAPSGLDQAAKRLRMFSENPAYGFTMDRDDARTVSQIQLIMEPGRVDFTYCAREPDGPGFGEPVHLSMGIA